MEKLVYMFINWIKTVSIACAIMLLSCQVEKQNSFPKLDKYFQTIASGKNLNDYSTVIIASPEGCKGCLSKLYRTATCEERDGRLFIMGNAPYKQICEDSYKTTQLIIDSNKSFKRLALHKGNIVYYYKTQENEFHELNVTTDNIDSLLEI